MTLKIVGWIIDDQPSPFIWQSSYPAEVFYNDYRTYAELTLKVASSLKKQ